MAGKSAGHKRGDSPSAPNVDAKHHYDKLFWADLEGDEELIDCSPAAQGVWACRMLPLMARAKRRGYFLRNNGSVPTEEYLKKRWGIEPDVFRPLIEELRAKGVFSVDENGNFYNRRMVREAAKSAPTETDEELQDRITREGVNAINADLDRKAKARARTNRWRKNKRNSRADGDVTSDGGESVTVTSPSDFVTRHSVTENVTEHELNQGCTHKTPLPGSHQPLSINQKSSSEVEVSAAATPHASAAPKGAAHGEGKDREGAAMPTRRRAALDALKALKSDGASA